MKLVELVQFLLENGTVPEDLGCKKLIIIPNANADTQVMGILELFWKVTEAIIDTCIKKVVTFHKVLHGFCAGRGTGASIVELNPAQELESVDRYLLLLVFFDIIKVYENLDHGRLLETLEGYGAGPKKWGILADF